jgi:hypothetical protein
MRGPGREQERESSGGESGLLKSVGVLVFNGACRGSLLRD